MGLFDFLRGNGDNPLAHDMTGDAHAPAHDSTASSDFRLEVEDVFTITGRGTVVTGRIASGSISSGASIRVDRVDGTTMHLQVDGIEKFRSKLDHASAGEDVGLLVRGGDTKLIARGDVLRAG